jgi:hypothetical protein
VHAAGRLGINGLGGHGSRVDGIMRSKGYIQPSQRSRSEHFNLQVPSHRWIQGRRVVKELMLETPEPHLLLVVIPGSMKAVYTTDAARLETHIYSFLRMTVHGHNLLFSHICTSLEQDTCTSQAVVVCCCECTMGANVAVTEKTGDIYA